MSGTKHVPEGGIDRWGQAGNLDEDKAAALAEFTSKAPPAHVALAKFKIETMENMSLRFLRARSFKVAKALVLLSECAAKKIEGKAKECGAMTADESANCDVLTMKKWYPHTDIGYDKFNRPILFEQTGSVNTTAMLNMTSFPSLVNYHYHNMETTLGEFFENAPCVQAERERARASSASSAAADSGSGSAAGEETSAAVISTCVVIDMTGFSVLHCASSMMDHMKALVAIDNTCYPETLGKMYVINSPWLAVTTWEIVKRWLDPRTQAKIEILGTGPETTQRLLECIPLEQLPARYGGTGSDTRNFPWIAERPLAEHVGLARLCSISRDFTLPAGKVLYVDSYVTDGEVEIEVTAGSRAMGASASGKIDMVSLLKSTLCRPSGQTTPFRKVHDFLNPTNEDMVFNVKWTNAASIYTRPLTINLFAKDIEETS